MGDRTRETVRLELMLEDASIKLSTVASSLNTVSARAMLTAMIDGESDPLRLAEMARGRRACQVFCVRHVVGYRWGLIRSG
jgi:hypothetical protein